METRRPYGSDGRGARTHRRWWFHRRSVRCSRTRRNDLSDDPSCAVEIPRNRVGQIHEQLDDPDGHSAEAIRDQCRRIAACSLRFAWQGQGARGTSHARIVSREMSFSAPRPERLWEDCVTLDADLFEALRRHPVPVAETAVRQLRDRSVSLDVYTWLSYRLHWLDKPIYVSWPALELQFGAGYSRSRAFRANFPAALAAAVAAYPDAKVGLDETGATLHPSAPPIRKLA